MNVDTRAKLTQESFVNYLGQMGIQRHLLAIWPRSLEEAVQAGNEYLQLPGPRTNPSHVVCAFKAEGEEGQTEKHESLVQAIGATGQSAILNALELLTSRFDELEA